MPLALAVRRILLGKLVYFSQLMELVAYWELAVCIPKPVYVHCTHCY